MALNIFEVIDVADGGDDVPEAFTKALNNWQALSAELLPGYMRRSIITWSTTTVVTVAGGIYEVNGTLARNTTTLTLSAHGLTQADGYIYLYIDYSAIPATGVCVAGTYFWSLTAPTFSTSKNGFYTANDRCIFAARAVSSLLLEFEHQVDLVLWGNQVTILSAVAIVPTTFTNVTACKIPLLSVNTKVPVLIQWTWVDATVSLWYRPDGSTAATGIMVGPAVTTDTKIATNICDIVTGTTGIIEMMESGASTNTCSMFQHGYYLPEGM